MNKTPLNLQLPAVSKTMERIHVPTKITALVLLPCRKLGHLALLWCILQKKKMKKRERERKHDYDKHISRDIF